MKATSTTAYEQSGLSIGELERLASVARLAAEAVRRAVAAWKGSPRLQTWPCPRR